VQHILAKQQASTLAAFASSNVLLGFDFDGTLAPIVPVPAAVRMRAHTRKLLAAVTRRYPAVVISGRLRADLIRRVGNVPIWHLAGNHGLEPWGEDCYNAAQVREWVKLLRRDLASFAGVVVEDKKYSVTVHYRHARNRRRVLDTLHRAVRSLSAARSIGGHFAVSIIPSGAPDKGEALDRARQLLVCDTAVYVGDDETDEDVFERANQNNRLLAIRVRRSRSSHAPYYLDDQNQIDELLERFLLLRPLRRRPLVALSN
jgi:trehalose 6-phosphate phosphatase